MAPSGTGPTRKSHTKSRKGCRTCKKRHIRCDENFPQWYALALALLAEEIKNLDQLTFCSSKNCTKHNVVCDYMESPPPAEDVPRGPAQPNLLSNSRVEAEIDSWRRSGIFPFPEMRLQAVNHFAGMLPTDLRLVHHLCSIYRDMRMADFVGCTFWVEELPRLLDAAYGYDFVMSAILAFSATHIAWLTKNPETKNLAYHHSGIAIKGLHEAIGGFSQENSDAVLAASILLAWQASDWGGWTSLMQGTSTIINLMAPWTHLSRFSSFLSNHPKFFSPSSAVIPLDDQALTLANQALRQLAARLPSVHPLAQRLQEILRFAEDFQYSSTSMQSEQIFAKLQPLRSWLFWMPVTLVKANDMSSSAMVLLAQLYTLALAIDSSIPELSGAALGSLSVQAIEQLDTQLCNKLNMALPKEMSPADLSNLMEFPRFTVAQNRLEQSMVQEALSVRGERQDSPYNFHRLSVGSQPGTPNYPPPGSPGLLNVWQSPSLEDLSHPPSPFLHYGVTGSRPHSQLFETGSVHSEQSFDVNRPLSQYDFQGDSPAYSPAAYSPAFLPEIPDDEWNFDVAPQDFTGSTGGGSPYDESLQKNKQHDMF